MHNLPPETDKRGEKISDSNVLHALRQKVLVASAITGTTYGTPNPELRAELLYDMLTRPDTVADEHNIDVDQFADRKAIVEAEVLRPKAELDRAEFIDFMLTLVRKPEIHQESMIPGFERALTELSAKGPLTIWTQGDVFERPPRGDREVDGRGEQLWKLQGGGIGALRKRLARSALGELSPQKLRTGLDVVVGSNKFTDTAADKLVERVAGADHVIVVEDILKHIVKLKELLEQRGVKDVTWFWVNTSEEDPPEGVVKVSSLTDIADLVNDMEGSVASVIDFDGVLSDQKKRAELVAKEIEKYLHNRGVLRDDETAA